MSGGIAYVYDPDNDFSSRFNDGLADLENLIESEDILSLRTLIEQHAKATDSNPANNILQHWDQSITKFKKVMPRDYRRVLDAQRLKSDENMEVANNG